MSTFDGLIDEFPSIRIDYFRHHPHRPPPHACFLSHVHSDHLQGLETLKMPFVYCSAATKKILLRMEKYPHRINFAKGILEVRKQTYRLLKLVLRALPLETPVEIELDPKSKIRVTLFDANHCPGAVMFLIEDSGKAILYTGDVRAEPWWVNSITRNPIILPYACGAKRLDCIYLDTTFASRGNIYDNFPTKAEGLKELLTKVSKCPKKSTFYFRSWTLGYEDVWIALSNYLQSAVHVDSYQLRIFRALADDTTNTDRGPALAGFNFGNQHQLGCLTDQPGVSIHSCEPGTHCHDNIKKQKDIVWIIPIISRLKDGTEVAEIGAGGGGGDLYQTPKLEVIDEATFYALENLYARSAQHKEALTKLGEAFSHARARGDDFVPLNGLDLEQDAELPLKQFIQLIAEREELANGPKGLASGRVIHFPYSRHSSFSELRHLVSSFRPKDVCPCTVDLDTWSEEVSMRNLFADICSDDVFRFDKENRLRAEGIKTGRGTKRKRGLDHDSQHTETQLSDNTDEAYTSAKTSLCNPNEGQPRDEQRRSSNATEAQERTKMPTPVRHLHKSLSNRFLATSPELERIATSSAGTAPNKDVEAGEGTSRDTAPGVTVEHDEADGESDTSSNSSVAFQSQDSIADSSPDRVTARKAAYRAAQSALIDNDPSKWRDLRLRSLGWSGHTEEETIL